jgi:hypothetical protein
MATTAVFPSRSRARRRRTSLRRFRSRRGHQPFIHTPQDRGHEAAVFADRVGRLGEHLIGRTDRTQTRESPLNRSTPSRRRAVRASASAWRTSAGSSATAATLAASRPRGGSPCPGPSLAGAGSDRRIVGGHPPAVPVRLPGGGRRRRLPVRTGGLGLLTARWVRAELGSPCVAASGWRPRSGVNRWARFQLPDQVVRFVVTLSG